MARPTRRWCILLTMVDAAYVEMVEEKRIVAIRPKPAFRPLLEVATTREGSGVVLRWSEFRRVQLRTGPQDTGPRNVPGPCVLFHSAAGAEFSR